MYRYDKEEAKCHFIVERTNACEFISIKSPAAKGEDEPRLMEGTANVPHQIADAHLL
jgi:hypothetical protein